jgi:hypothetical protein
LVKGKWPKLSQLSIGNKYFYLGHNKIGIEGMDWLHLNEWKMLKSIRAYPIQKFSTMPLIAYTWNSEKGIEYYTRNEYIRNEM